MVLVFDPFTPRAANAPIPFGSINLVGLSINPNEAILVAANIGIAGL
jgi:hypothetical protein